MGHEGSASYETEFKGTPPFTLTSLDGSKGHRLLAGVGLGLAVVRAIAREEGDYLSEQFVQWFLKEQVEEEATMTELLDVAERVRDFPMTLEEYIARERPGGGEDADPMAPPAAGAPA